MSKTVQGEIFIRLVKQDGEYRIGEFSGSNAIETHEFIIEVNRVLNVCNRTLKEYEEIRKKCEGEKGNTPTNVRRVEEYFRHIECKCNHTGWLSGRGCSEMYNARAKPEELNRHKQSIISVDDRQNGNNTQRYKRKPYRVGTNKQV